MITRCNSQSSSWGTFRFWALSMPVLQLRRVLQPAKTRAVEIERNLMEMKTRKSKEKEKDKDKDKDKNEDEDEDEERMNNKKPRAK